MDTRGNETMIDAPKTIDRLEALSLMKALEEEDDDDDEKIKIGGDIFLELSDVNDLNRPQKILPPPILDDIVMLV
jgi:hypothetical protein